VERNKYHSAPRSDYNCRRWEGQLPARHCQEVSIAQNGSAQHGHKQEHLTPLEWLICAVAAIGFAFDTYEILALTLMVRPALTEFLGPNASRAVFNHWVGIFFYVPAVAGGVFGLLGGYFIDLLGRRRILLWSIILYCASAVATAYATTPLIFRLFRCGAFVGVSVEFVAATAWLAELFTDRDQREAVLGYTQGFASTGGLLVSAAYYIAVTFSQHLPAIRGAHEAWRYTAISGLFPAIPLLLVRPFLPESPIWKRKKLEGTLQRPSIFALFRPAFRKTAVLTCIMMACAYAASFGMLQHFARILPGTPEIRVLSRAMQEQRIGKFQGIQEMGGLAGRILMAFLAVRIISRRRLLRIFQVPGLILIPLVLFVPAIRDANISAAGNFALGLLTVAQFSFWGNYLPLVFPTYLRGTGESFAANIGGRMLGTSAALIVTSIVEFMPGGVPTRQLAYAAGIVGLASYAIGFGASFWLPEPSLQITPE
jgi:MFS family permease